MPPPNLIPCGFCSRLYSIYSLKHHLPKCSENPENNFRPLSAAALTTMSSKVRRRNTTSGRSKSNSRKIESRNGFLKRSRSVGGSSAQKRPETQTINSQIGYLKLKEDIEKRPCYVCGKWFKSERLDSHSRKCEINWKKSRSEMSKFIEVSSPISVQIPSIDGTIDLARIDQLALKSAEKAQNAKCIKCFKEMNFGEAITHRCPKREPTIEFFF
uniref:Uncharacterized protein n=1 Tax=Panagrolaimus davidi TaxID=227884 RepID=A0A914QDX0_9BILA